MEEPKHARNHSVKLPKLVLRKFSGNPTEFNAFYELYMSSVDSNHKLGNIEKFTYLRSMLTDKASACVKGLALSADNYSEALNILKNRFGNRQVIIAKHMERLSNLAPVSSGSNVKELRNLYDQIEANVRSLQTLGVDSGSYGSLLVSVLLTRIPEEIRLIVTREYTEGSDWNLDNLLKALEKELSARERCRMISQEDRLSTVHTLNVNESQIRCVYCNNKHKSVACRTISDPIERKKYLMQNRRCFLCLSDKHKASHCASKHAVVNAKISITAAYMVHFRKKILKIRLVIVLKCKRKKVI